MTLKMFVKRVKSVETLERVQIGEHNRNKYKIKISTKKVKGRLGNLFIRTNVKQSKIHLQMWERNQKNEMFKNPKRMIKNDPYIIGKQGTWHDDRTLAVNAKNFAWDKHNLLEAVTESGLYRLI